MNLSANTETKPGVKNQAQKENDSIIDDETKSGNSSNYIGNLPKEETKEASTSNILFEALGPSKYDSLASLSDSKD